MPVEERGPVLGQETKAARARRLTDEWRRDDQVATATQWLTTNRIDLRINPDWTLMASGNFSQTIESGGHADGRFVETSLGFAFRPVRYDRVNVLAKYAFLYDLPSEGQVSSRTNERAHV